METGIRTTSMRQLAKELGVSQSFLSQIKTGRRPMPDALREKVEASGAYHLLITDKLIQGHEGEAPASSDTILVGAGRLHPTLSYSVFPLVSMFWG